MRIPSLPPSSRFPFLPALLLAGLLFAAAIPRSAGFALLDYYLPDGNFPMQLQLQNGGPSGQNWNQIAQECLQQWNQYLTGTKFTWVANSTSAKGEYNRKNDVFWSKDIYGETFPDGVLGVTLMWVTENDETTIYETDTIFNSGFSGGWDSYRGSLRYKNDNITVDFRRVAIHEFGHTLGLDHPDENGEYVTAVMNSQISNTDDLTTDDIAGTVYYYGAKAAPTLTNQPADASFDAPRSIRLSAYAKGRGPVWATMEKDGKIVGGPAFVPPKIPPSAYGNISFSPDLSWGTGTYTLIASNRYGSTRSRAIKVTVNGLVTKMPVDQTVFPGATAKFSIGVQSDAKATFQWYRQTGWRDDLISGATGSTLTLTKVQLEDEGYYYAVVRSGDWQSSIGAHLRIKLGVTISPAATAIRDGESATLSAQLMGTPRFRVPGALAVDAKSNVYVMDSSNVRKITPSGIVSTLSSLDWTGSLAADAAGNLYLGRNETLAKLTAAGELQMLVGNDPSYGRSTRDGRTTLAHFTSIRAIAAGKDGSLYIIDTMRTAIRKLSPSGVVSTLAGVSDGDDNISSRKDGLGTAARFLNPWALTVSADGTVYVIDRDDSWTGLGHVIRKITASGRVTTFAGGATGSSSQIDGKGSDARFANPQGIAVDSSGTLYVTDAGTVRKISLSGVVSTLAGDSKQSGNTDGTGTAARFGWQPAGIAVGTNGLVYIADPNNRSIRKITPAGVVTTYAGGAPTTQRDGEGTYDGDTRLSYQWKLNGKAIAGATRPTLVLPAAHKADIGRYTVTITNTLGSVTSTPATVDIMPTFTTGLASQIKLPGAKITLAPKIVNPAGRSLTYQWTRNGVIVPGATGPTLVIDRLDSSAEGTYVLLVSDGVYTATSSATVQLGVQLTQQPQSARYADGTTVRLTPTVKSVLEPLFGSIGALVADASGNIFSTETGNRVVRKITAAKVVSTLAGSPYATQTSAAGDGKGRDAFFRYPRGLARTASGLLYVADNCAVRKLTADGTVTTLAGNAMENGDLDAKGTNARFTGLSGIATDKTGNIYVAESVNGGRIRKITPAGTVTTFAVNFCPDYVITGLAVDASGNLFTAGKNHALYKITAAGVASLFAGQAGETGDTDGTASAARFGTITSLAIDAQNNLYVFDFPARSVRKISPEGVVSTITRNLFPETSLYWEVSPALCVDSQGRIYLGDPTQFVVRTITTSGEAPIWVGDPGGGYRDGSGTRYQWQFAGKDIPGATSLEFEISNLQADQAGDYRLTLFSSIGTTCSDVASISRSAAAAWDIALDTSTRTVAPGGLIAFSATARGTEPLSYQWLKDGAALPGATGSSLAIDQVATTDAGYYSVRISNAAGFAISPASAVDVTDLVTTAPTIWNSLTDVPGNLRAGSGRFLSLNAISPSQLTGTLRFQWMKDGVAIAGATSATLNFSRLVPGDSAAYTVKISGNNGSLVSKACCLTVPPAQLPVILTQPASVSTTSGNSKRLTVLLKENEAEESYQWYKDGGLIPGAIGRTLVITNVSVLDQGDYTLVITSDAGSVTSKAARLTVQSVPPSITFVDTWWTKTNEDTWSEPIAFTISDLDTPIASLVVTATSENSAFIPVANIILGGSGSQRTIRFKGAPNAVSWGCYIRITVSDGVSSSSASLRAEISSVNDAPVIDPIANRTFKPDGKVRTIALPLADDNGLWGLSVSATSSNQLIFPNASLQIAGGYNSRVLQLTPQTGRTGTAVITVRASDGDYTTSRKFTVTVVASNRAPTISSLANQSVNEDSTTAALPFSIGDPDTAASVLNLSVKSSNTKLVPVANVVFGGSGANRTVKVTPAANQSGTANITVTVSDGALSASRTFTLTVKPVNDTPTISPILNQTLYEDRASDQIAFTIGDVETAAASLKLSATSSNPTLLPATAIVFRGSGANRTVKLTPAANQSGTAKITVTVSDGALSASRTFTLTVKPVNDAPTITALANQTINEDTATAALPFTVGDVETAAASLKVTAATSNSTLLPVGSIVLGGSGANRTVKLTPAANQNGTAIVTLTVSDGQLSAARLFKLTVQAVNDTPTISAIADQTVPEGTSTQVLSFTIADVESAPGFLTVSAASSNSALLPAASLALGGSGANRTLTLAPAAGQIGSSTVSLTVSDGSLTATRSFTFTVAPLPLVTLSAPARQVVAPGAAFSFGVSATGTGAFSYQWWHNGRAIAGATSATFNGLAAAASDAGYYWVDVSDSVGTRRSATVFVLLSPSATTIAGWGDDSLQQTEPPAATTPFVALAASSGHALALSADGTVAAWGSSHPLVPADLTEVVAIAAGQSFAVALRADGSAVSWGDLAGAFAGVPLVAISSGPSHVLGVTRDGTVAGAGLATSGQLTIPAGLDHVTAVAAGATHSLALKSDGSVVAWGGNAAGQATVPAGLADVVAIAAGDDFSLALKSDGTVAAWGGNASHQTDVPAGLANVIAIGAGTDHALALTSDGSVVAWGDSLSGQTTVPAGLDRVVAIAAGDAFSLALRDATPDAAPAFTTQPADQAVLAGGAVDFVVIASGHPGIAFQWQQSTDGGTTWTDLTDGPAITGTQTSVLSLSAVDLAMSGRQFRCVTSNSVASGVASAAATLVVNAP